MRLRKVKNIHTYVVCPIDNILLLDKEGLICPLCKSDASTFRMVGTDITYAFAIEEGNNNFLTKIKQIFCNHIFLELPILFELLEVGRQSCAVCLFCGKIKKGYLANNKELSVESNRKE